MPESFTRWTEVDSDPNAPAVRSERREILRKACKGTIVDRIHMLQDFCRGQRVLDVGCVNHGAKFEVLDDWLHQHVAKASSSCLGIDILEADVGELAAKGYNVRVHDLTREPLQQNFDVIVCGEMIEHIESTGSFFENIRLSLSPSGSCVLTTPFPWFLGYTLRNSSRRHNLPGSADHVAWFDPSSLCELAQRHGMVLDAYYGVLPKRERGGIGRAVFETLLSAVRRGWILGIHPYCGCRSLLYVLKPATDTSGKK